MNTPPLNGSKKGFGNVFQMHSNHRNFLQFSFVLILCLFASLVLLSKPVHAAPLDSAVTATSPHDGAKYVSVDSPVTVTFDRNITLSTDTTKITLVNSTTNGNVVIQPVTVSGKTLTVTPKANLDFGASYVLNIAQDGVTDTANGNATFLTQTNKLSFSTDYCTFTDLMINNTPKIVDWLNTQGYTPRDIKLFAPTRYINAVDVLNKNNTKITSSANESASESVTNFDITTDSRIQRVTVTTDNSGIARDAKLLQTSGSTSVFTIGFANLPASFGFTISAYVNPSATSPDDSQTGLIAQSTQPVVEFKQTYHYVTSGGIYTLYNLMKNQSSFQSLLTENTADQIKAQVVGSVAQ